MDQSVNEAPTNASRLLLRGTFIQIKHVLHQPNWVTQVLLPHSKVSVLVSTAASQVVSTARYF